LDFRFWIEELATRPIQNLKSKIQNGKLLILSMQCMAAATAAELFELEPVRRALLVLRRHVIALLTIRALQNNVVSSAFRHFLPLSAISSQQLAISSSC
jgi:hypothetical protein